MSAAFSKEITGNAIAIKNDDGDVIAILDNSTNESEFNSMRGFLYEHVVGASWYGLFTTADYSYTTGLSGDALYEEFSKLSMTKISEIDQHFFRREQVVNALMIAHFGETDLRSIHTFRSQSKYTVTTDEQWEKKAAEHIENWSHLNLTIVGDRIMLNETVASVFSKILAYLGYSESWIATHEYKFSN